MAKIILKGEPISTGHIYRSVCRGRFPKVYVTKEGKDLRESYRRQASAQWKLKPLIDEVGVTIRLYFGTKRKADIDNFGKLLLDSLTGIVYKDDSQIVAMTVEKHYDKANPRIEVSI